MPDSGVCAISPSDLVGYVGNLINRVKELEQQVAEIKTGNVEVNQLSDLSQQVGWVSGVNYMGVPGWTQTTYGTLIPPPGFSLVGSGFTMSDGNEYNGVYYDTNGTLQFGFLANGTGLGGALPTAWTAGSNPVNYAVTKRIRVPASLYESSRGITITASAPVGEGDAQLTVSQAGIYLVNGAANWTVGSATAYSGTLSLVCPDTDQNIGCSRFIDTDSANILSWEVNTLLNLSAGDMIELTIDVTPAGAGGTLENFEFSAIRITSN